MKTLELEAAGTIMMILGELGDEERRHVVASIVALANGARSPPADGVQGARESNPGATTEEPEERSPKRRTPASSAELSERIAELASAAGKKGITPEELARATGSSVSAAGKALRRRWEGGELERVSFGRYANLGTAACKGGVL